MLVAAADGLHADAVPFPLGREIGCIQPRKVGVLDRVRQHHRPERRGDAVDRFFGAAFEPCEQIEIWRRETWPDQFDIVRVLVAERRRRGLGEPRGHADPHRAGDEFQERPATDFVQLVEPAGELRRQFGLAEGAQRGDDIGERGRRRFAVVLAHQRRGPHQRHRFGEIADVIVGQGEQHRVGARGDQTTDKSGLGVLERQCAGQRSQRVAAIRIRRLAKICGDQPQFVIAAGFVGKTVEQFGETVHEPPSSPNAAASSSSLSSSP